MKAPPPSEILRALPPASAPLARALVEAADARGWRLFLVGGPVRDFLLGRAVRDVDLVVEGEGAEAASELVRAAAPPGARVASHGRFGTVALEAEGGAVDVATARRETYAHDGALPRVEPGAVEEDLRRRDFTVNALAMPLSKAARAGGAEIADPDDGLGDLRARRLRVLHARSFHDDPTRALRAARLAPRLGFSPTRGSRAALRDALRDGAFGRVSGDRLRRELVKLFEDGAQGLDPARALRLLDDWHVLPALEPGLALPRDALSPLRRIGRAARQSPWPGADARLWVSGFCVWLAPQRPGLRRRALRRFSLRGEWAARIADFPALCQAKLPALARARGRGAIDALLADVENERLLALFAQAPVPVRRRIVRYAAQDRPRRSPVTGDDLVALGFHGPAVGRALARIRAAHLDGKVRTQADALALAQELLRERPPVARAARRRKKA